jgi:hypothetical protein
MKFELENKTGEMEDLSTCVTFIDMGLERDSAGSTISGNEFTVWFNRDDPFAMQVVFDAWNHPSGKPLRFRYTLGPSIGISGKCEMRHLRIASELKAAFVQTGHLEVGTKEEKP